MKMLHALPLCNGWCCAEQRMKITTKTKAKKLTCELCGMKYGIIKFYIMPGDEVPHAYHTTCKLKKNKKI